MLTAEIKKGRYIYYPCTQSGHACDELFYWEEELGPRFDKFVRGINIDPSNVEEAEAAGYRVAGNCPIPQ